LNYVALVTHTFWKPISRNAIFVTQESEPKRQEYQDEVVKVFYIQNASTPNEFTEIFNGVRTGAKLTTGIFQVASQNAIIARGTPDTISLVEKLVHDLDRPKAEVVVDVMVMEVSKSKMSTLGAAIAGQTGGLNVPIVFAPQNGTVITTGSTTSTSGTTSTTTGTTDTSTGTTTSTTGTTGTTTGTTTGSTTGTTTGTTGASSFIPLSQLGHLSTNDWQISLPGALIQAMLTDASTRLLQRPEVRVTDGGKASLKIGSKIPYVSGSLNSAVATPGAIPYATTQFQQVDVGVQIDLTPHVNGPEDVSMHIKVEISNVTQTVNIAGVQQPVIGQKVDEADIRMKDGEVSLLGGLTSDSDSRTTAGIPGVANMPVLGYLFGTRTKDREKDDIVVALIPHIVRSPDLSNIADQGVYVGTERVVRVGRRPDGTLVPQTPLPVPSNPQQPTPGAPVHQPAPAAPATRPPASYPPLQPNPSPGPQNQAPAAPQRVPPDRPPLLAPQSSPQPNSQPSGPPNP
jgi:general secretion pathway protein D